MHALKLLARRVPDELSVIAYSFLEDADFLDPPPCCIMEDFAEIAMQATLLLLRQLDGCSSLCDISVNYLFRYGASVRDVRDSFFSDLFILFHPIVPPPPLDAEFEIWYNIAGKQTRRTG